MKAPNFWGWPSYALAALAGALLWKLPGIFAWLGQSYMPHSHCYGSDPQIFWPLAIGHTLTFLAYVGIPALLFRLYTDRAINLTAAALFMSFIAACGLGHLLVVLEQYWWPAYRLSGWWAILTAMASMGTMWQMWKHSDGFLAVHKENARLVKELDDLIARTATVDQRLEELGRMVPIG